MGQSSLGLGGRLASAAIVGINLLSFAPSVRAESCCNGNQPPLASTAVGDFKNNPQLILTQNPIASGPLIAQVRDLLLSDSTTLPVLLGLLSSANSDQKSAIAAGFAEAQRLWQGGDAGFALQIQQAVAETSDAAFILAYSRAMGDEPIGAAGTQ